MFKSDVFVYAVIVANARADIDTISGTIDCLTKCVAIELSLALSHDFANIGATSRTDACADVCFNETDGEAFAFPTGSTDNIDIVPNGRFFDYCAGFRTISPAAVCPGSSADRIANT